MDLATDAHTHLYTCIVSKLTKVTGSIDQYRHYTREEREATYWPGGNLVYSLWRIHTKWIDLSLEPQSCLWAPMCATAFFHPGKAKAGRSALTMSYSRWKFVYNTNFEDVELIGGWEIYILMSESSWRAFGKAENSWSHRERGKLPNVGQRERWDRYMHIAEVKSKVLLEQSIVNLPERITLFLTIHSDRRTTRALDRNSHTSRNFTQTNTSKPTG